jgi:serine/threonine protein kinase
VAHRDIKLENFLLENKTNKIYLIDFGLCFIAEKKDTAEDFVGSQHYIAPEVKQLKEYCPFKADVYSLGVVLYAMVFCRIPYFFNWGKDWGKVRFPTGLPKIYQPVKDLLEKMLWPYPLERISLQGITKHPWIADKK